jgi:hypothetical protein
MAIPVPTDPGRPKPFPIPKTGRIRKRNRNPDHAAIRIPERFSRDFHEALASTDSANRMRKPSETRWSSSKKSRTKRAGTPGRTEFRKQETGWAACSKNISEIPVFSAMNEMWTRMIIRNQTGNFQRKSHSLLTCLFSFVKCNYQNGSWKRIVVKTP